MCTVYWNRVVTPRTEDSCLPDWSRREILDNLRFSLLKVQLIYFIAFKMIKKKPCLWSKISVCVCARVCGGGGGHWDVYIFLLGS